MLAKQSLAKECRSTKEHNLFVVALIFSSLVWVGVVVSLVGLLYAPFVALAVVVGHAFFLARLTGNSIRVGSRQLPDLYRRVESAAAKLGLEQVPEVYVTSGGGVLNAFATKLFSRRFLVLNSEIVDACEELSDDAVDFIIGHEMGHLALGHLSMSWLLWPAKLMPLLGAAYSRACEYSSDACGLAAVDGNTETAARALAVLSAGGKLAKRVSVDGLLEQRHETGGLVMALVELNSSHPFLCKRVAALHRDVPAVGRNPLSYVMAPFFGFAAGGVAGLATVYMYVAVIGVLAAVAIPSFQKYQERARLVAGPVDITAPQAPPSDDNAALPAFDQQKLDDALKALQAAQPRAPAADALAVGHLDADTDNHADDDAAPVPPPRFEAKSWLKGQIVAKNADAVSNYGTFKGALLVDKLYKAGAKQVFVSDVGVDVKGVYANDIIVEMPAKPALRKKLVDLCSAEYKKAGSDEPCFDDGPTATTELYFNWN